jgi:hypothetical protein
MGATISGDKTSPAMSGAGGGIFRSPAREFVLIFFLSFAVRASLLVFWANTHEDFYRPGGEMGRVALSLLRTGQFADPYKIPTGPTAHPPPFWPALLALIVICEEEDGFYDGRLRPGRQVQISGARSARACITWAISCWNAIDFAAISPGTRTSSRLMRISAACG